MCMRVGYEKPIVSTLQDTNSCIIESASRNMFTVKPGKPVILHLRTDIRSA